MLQRTILFRRWTTSLRSLRCYKKVRCKDRSPQTESSPLKQPMCYGRFYNMAASLVNLMVQESASAMRRGGFIQRQQIDLQTMLFVFCRLDFTRSNRIPLVFILHSNVLLDGLSIIWACVILSHSHLKSTPLSRYFVKLYSENSLERAYS